MEARGSQYKSVESKLVGVDGSVCGGRWVYVQVEVVSQWKVVEIDTMEVRESLYGNSWKSMEVSGRQWK